MPVHVVVVAAGRAAATGLRYGGKAAATTGKTVAKGGARVGRAARMATTRGLRLAGNAGGRLSKGAAKRVARGAEHAGRRVVTRAARRGWRGHGPHDGPGGLHVGGAGPRRRRGARGVVSGTAGVAFKEAGESWHGGDLDSMPFFSGSGRSRSPLAGVGGLAGGRRRRGPRLGRRVGSGAKGLIGKSLAPLRKLRPKRPKRPKLLPKKVRRVVKVVLLVVAVLLAVSGSTVIAAIEEEQAEGELASTAPAVLATGVAQSCQAGHGEEVDVEAVREAIESYQTTGTIPAEAVAQIQEQGGLQCPDAMRAATSGPLGAVGGIPYAEAFNATAELGIDPRLVAAVAWAESDFAEDVIGCRRASRAGAQGIMQLMPGTARELGVDPCEPEEAIRGGARYLLQQYEAFDDWELALAAYNAGPGQVEPCNCVPNITETENYVAKVMAKWDEYKRQFPEEEIGGSVPPAGIQPRGGTDRYSEPQNTDTMQNVLDAVIRYFGRSLGVGCFRAGDQDHGLGRACDIMMADGNELPSATMRAHGQALADWLVANAQELRIQYVIWEQRIWNIDRAGEGWRRMGNRGNHTQNHYDHVHISVQPEP